VTTTDITVQLLNDSPLVCICVPTYNAANTVARSLKSILAQTYRNLSVTISDNASTDSTLEVIGSITDERLSVHKQQVNTGAEANFTNCIRVACGKYTAICHADDVYEPQMVEKQVAFLENNPDVVAVFTRALMIDEHDVPFGEIGGVPGSHDEVSRLEFRGLLRKMLLHHNFLVCPGVMVRTEVFKNEIKEWGSSAFRSASDVDTWLRLTSAGPIAVLEAPLMRYRISSTQFSHLNRTRTERLDFFLVMEHYLARSDVRAFLTTADLRHYGWLERHERVSRAMNHFGLGLISEAKNLLKGVFCWDAIRAAISTRRGFVTLAGFFLVRSLIPFGQSPYAIKAVKAAKRISWR
jgi:glycosyltransferase involved in cell wall biosynthesis